MSNDTVDKDKEPNMMEDFDYSDKIGGIITYITGNDVSTSEPTDTSSLITKAHKLVLMFKFIAALGEMKILPITLERITRYTKIAKDDGLPLQEIEYFAALLT